MAKSINTKSTKAEILAAFNELKKEKSALETQVKNLEKNAPAQMLIQETPSLETVSNMTPAQPEQQKMKYTLDSLMLLQSGFGSAISELSEKLTSEATKLTEIQTFVRQEVEQLEALHGLTIEADTLENLIHSYEINAKEFAAEISQTRESLEEEVSSLVKNWNKEQENYQRNLKERNENQGKLRQRDAQEYRYNLQLERKIDQEDYEQNKKTRYKELAAARLEQEKQWQEREKSIADREKDYLEAEMKVEAFPAELEKNIKNGKENGRNIGNYQAKVKGDLRAKEIEGQKRAYELRIESLEESILTQETRLQSLAKQLDSALKQVQDLAVKAIEGSANMSSLQTMKEIALEQAKNAQKNK